MTEMAGNTHPFSPIINAERLELALSYVAKRSVALAEVAIGRSLAIDTICFFTHSPEEYTFLANAVRNRGTESRLSHGATLYTDTNFMVGDQRIRIFGVRAPDPTRPFVGYGDYPVADYDAILQKHQSSPYVREITSGRGKSLIELKHPDFDVLGFVVDKEDHK